MTAQARTQAARLGLRASSISVWDSGCAATLTAEQAAEAAHAGQLLQAGHALLSDTARAHLLALGLLPLSAMTEEELDDQATLAELADEAGAARAVVGRAGPAWSGRKRQ